MTTTSRRAVVTLPLTLVLVALAGPAARMQQASAKHPIALDDIVAWKSITQAAVSNDGQWFGYRFGPSEGDVAVVIRRTSGTEKPRTFDIGEPPAPPAPSGGPPSPAPSSNLEFSEDSRWAAFMTYPTRRDAQRLKRQRRPIESGVAIVNLSTGEKRDYGKIRKFAFSGEASTWIAMQRYAPAPPPGGGAAPSGPPAGDGPNIPPDRPRGTDLILRELATGQELNIGNVADFAFTRDGRYLAWTIDAQDKVGNGIQLRDMVRGIVTVLDSGRASYERPSWTDKGDGLAVLRGYGRQGLQRQALYGPRLHGRGVRPDAEDYLRSRRGQEVSRGDDDQRQPRSAVDR